MNEEKRKSKSTHHVVDYADADAETDTAKDANMNEEEKNKK